MINKGAGSKKLDILNLFYSLGAVIILLGVIAKLLEWEVQDIFMTVGLTMEAVVFGVSSIKFINKDSKESNTAMVVDNQFHTEEPKATITPFETEKVNDQLIHSYVLPNQVDNTLNNSFPQNISFPQEVTNGFPPETPLEQLAPDLLWQLDKLGIISFPDDIFYQPEWIGFTEEEYNQVTQLFLDLFGKKVIPQKNITSLKSYGIRLPESGIGSLHIEQPIQMSNDSIKVLLHAFKPYRYKGFFDQFMLYTEGEKFYIRSAKTGEMQVYAGLSLATKNYCTLFHKDEMVVSPALDFLAPFIKLKNEILLDYLLKRTDIHNVESVSLMVQVLFDKTDPTKIYYLDKFKTVEYNSEKKDTYQTIKSIILLLASFTNQKVAKDILGKILVCNSDNGSVFKLENIVNIPKNGIEVLEGRVFMTEDLFDAAYINNCNKIQELEQQLINEKFVHPDIIKTLFNSENTDSIKSLYKKYNQYIDQYGITQDSKQIEFSLLCKKAIQ
jgi:hypothetical protein